MSRICLVGSTSEFATFVEAAFAGGAPITITQLELSGFDPETVAEIVSIDPDLVVVGPAISESDALKIIGEVDVAAPHLSSILVANPTVELWPQSLHAGARDIVAPLSNGATIRECFERAIEAGRRLRGAASDVPSSPSAGRVFAVVSPKGGSGKTTVAANLAATVALQRPDDVVVADLDVQFGDIGYAFRLEPEYSLLNAVAPGVTPTVLKGFLTPHSSKVLALAAPEHPEEADDISPEAAKEVVQTLSRLFGVVIVDTPAGLDERTLTVLDVATDIVLVTATDVPSVRAAVKELAILRRLGLLDKRRHHMVLNRADARVGLSVNDIEETIGLKATMTLPSTRSIPSALNLGEPAVLADQRSNVARSFQRFAEDLGIMPASDSNRSWRFGR